MAQPRLRADFFVMPGGIAIPKAPPLKRSHALRIFRRDAGVCQKCGARVKFGGNCVSPFDKIKSGAVDHIMPRSRGGQNTDDNLQLLCMSCNSQKGARLDPSH